MRSCVFTRSIKLMLVVMMFSLQSIIWFRLFSPPPPPPPPPPSSSSTRKKHHQNKTQLLRDIQIDLVDNNPNKTQSTRNILIDLGANCGNSYKRLLKTNQLDREGNWEVYLWEANPQLIELYLNDIQSEELVPANHDVHVIEAAAAASDGIVSFYLTAGQELIQNKSQFPDRGRCDPDSVANPSGSSSLLSNKKRVGKAIQVKAIDFAKWMNDYLQASDEDYLMIKIDIEGSELQLLDRLMEVVPSGFCHIDKLFIEWHAFKFNDRQTRREHTEYANNFTDKYARVCGRPIELATWH